MLFSKIIVVNGINKLQFFTQHRYLSPPLKIYGELVEYGTSGYSTVPKGMNFTWIC